MRSKFLFSLIFQLFIISFHFDSISVAFQKAMKVFVQKFFVQLFPIVQFSLFPFSDTLHEMSSLKFSQSRGNCHLNINCNLQYFCTHAGKKTSYREQYFSSQDVSKNKNDEREASMKVFYISFHTSSSIHSFSLLLSLNLNLKARKNTFFARLFFNKEGKLLFFCFSSLAKKKRKKIMWKT